MLYYSMKELMNYTVEKLPFYSCPEQMANRFNDFLSDKVKNIVNNLPRHTSELHAETCIEFLWSEHLPITHQNLPEICKDLSNSVTPADTIPAKYLKLFISCNVQFFTDLVNCVLASGVFPKF